MSGTRPTAAWYPYVFALFPLAYVITHMAGRAWMLELGFYAVVMPLVVLLLSLIARAVLLDRRRVPVAVSVFWLWLFSYSSARAMMEHAFGGMVWPHAYAIPAWIAVLTVVWVLIVASRVDYSRATSYLNVCATILVVGTASEGMFRTSAHDVDWKPNDVLERVVGGQGSIQNLFRPDIYFLIFDAYGSPREIEKAAGMDGSGIERYLRLKGFHVADGSHANYGTTFLSIGSTLNLQYLPMQHVNGTYRVEAGLERAIQDNVIRRYLLRLEYRCVDLSLLASRDTGGDSSNGGARQALAGLELLNMTIGAKPLAQNLAVGMLKRRDDEWRRAALRSAVVLDGPKFVYAHFMTTHNPYAFRLDGSPVGLWDAVSQSTSNKRLYVDQVAVANMVIVEFVDLILARDPSAVIIVQGDHGPALLDGDDGVRLRMSNFNAQYMPRAQPGVLRDSASSVNTFRTLANTYFSAKLDILEDRYYHGDVQGQSLVDVTGLLSGPRVAAQ